MQTMSKKRARDLSPVIVYPRPSISLGSCYEICDLCMEPQEPGEERLCGRAHTYVNADKSLFVRELAELALKLYNKKKGESFKLLKVCKANVVGAGYYGLTFRAQQDGSEECPLFRGVVHVVGGKKAMFCGIKRNEEVRLRLDDDDYVGSKGASESGDCSCRSRKKETGDGNTADSGGLKRRRISLLLFKHFWRVRRKSFGKVEKKKSKTKV